MVPAVRAWMTRATAIKLAVAAMAVVAVLVGLRVAGERQFPPDTERAGAYVRIAHSVAEDAPERFFAYLETEAQWACFTIRDARAEALRRITQSYPEPARSEMVAQYKVLAAAPDGKDVFATVYRERGWSKRLRKDLSGVRSVEVSGERASIITSHGTRWPFRRRDNGIWGLTVFTAELSAEAEKATRDLAMVKAAAADYDRLRSQSPAPERL